jgi:hypothetical protein
MTNQMIRTIRIRDGEATQIDVSVDFVDQCGTNGDTMFFEIEQEQSIFMSIEGIESVLAAAKLLKAEFEKFKGAK